MTPVVSRSSAYDSNSRPGRELERQPGGRQLLEHQRPVRRVAGVHAGPDRRRRRQRLEVRVVAQQRREHRHHPRRVRHPDVHVHAPDQHLPAPPLGAVDQLLVAVALGQLLPGPRRERVRARAEQVESEVVPGRYDDLERPPQVGHRLGHGAADAGDDLDGVLQQLLVQPLRVRQPGLGPGEEVRGVVAQVAGLPVDQRELPLHAERRLGRGVEVDPHPVRVPQGQRRQPLEPRRGEPRASNRRGEPSNGGTAASTVGHAVDIARATIVGRVAELDPVLGRTRPGRRRSPSPSSVSITSRSRSTARTTSPSQHGAVVMST